MRRGPVVAQREAISLRDEVVHLEVHARQTAEVGRDPFDVRVDADDRAAGRVQDVVGSEDLASAVGSHVVLSGVAELHDPQGETLRKILERLGAAAVHPLIV